MKLSEIAGVSLPSPIRVAFVPNSFELTSEVSSENEPYYVGKLVKPVTVRCSVDREVLPMIDVDELYIRESDVQSEDWVMVTEGKPEDGAYLKGYKTDFSKGQEFCLYQATTIAEWTRGNRKSKNISNRMSLNDRIKAREDQLKKGKQE